MNRLLTVAMLVALALIALPVALVAAGFLILDRS